jgi:hypothetical protein
MEWVRRGKALTLVGRREQCDMNSSERTDVTGERMRTAAIYLKGNLKIYVWSI